MTPNGSGALPWQGVELRNLPKLDYEQKIIDFAKRVLDDVPECREADYSVRWNQNSKTKDVVPFLVVAFSIPGMRDKPAIGLALVTVAKGTMLETMSGKYLLEGDKLRDYILRSVHDYLNKHGIVINPCVP